MINQNVDFENPKTEIRCESGANLVKQFGKIIRELQISRLLTKSKIKGKIRSMECGKYGALPQQQGDS